MTKSIRTQRKTLSLLMSIVMILTALPLVGITVFAETSGDFNYEILEDGTAEITVYTGNATILDIPSTLDGYIVTCIGDSAFEYCDSLTSVTIPNGVTRIGNYAFYSCDSLTSIIIPDSVTSIGNVTFKDCHSLASVTIPDSVAIIGDSAFEYCDSLTSITVPDSVTSIGNYAFDDCHSLTSVTIGKSVTNIGKDAFSWCDRLTSITVDINNINYSSQDGVLFNKEKTELIQYPIGNTRVSYVIPNGVAKIDESAFNSSYSLTSITVPNSITSIGEFAFSNCANLASITVPDSVTSIGGHAFVNCQSLTSITIPNSVTSIGEFAFSWCDRLTSITVDINNINYSSQDGVLFNKEKTELIQYPIGNTRVSYVIPNGVTKINECAFDSCFSLTSVTVPYSVTRIDGNAFTNCDNLSDIYILNADCYIESYRDYTIPQKITIHGYVGSTAEAYANEWGNKFLAIEEVTDDPTPDDPIEPTPDTPEVIGDINGDGKLTTVDAKWILQNIANSRSFDEAQTKASDLNGDGKISVVDVKWVLQIIAGTRDADTLELIKK